MSEADSHAVYSLETIERITHVSRDRIVLYYQYGLITPVEKVEEPSRLAFDETAVHRLRRLAFLLSEYEINSDGLRAVATLLDELERLRQEVRFLRER